MPSASDRASEYEHRYAGRGQRVERESDGVEARGAGEPGRRCATIAQNTSCGVVGPSSISRSRSSTRDPVAVRRGRWYARGTAAERASARRVRSSAGRAMPIASPTVAHRSGRVGSTMASIRRRRAPPDRRAPPLPSSPARSPPADAALERVLHLVEVAGERAGRQVLPAAVGQQRDDRAARPSSAATRAAATRTAPDDGPAKMPSRSTRSRSAAIASRLRHEVLRVEQRRVEDLGHEPLVERAQALDLLAGQRLGRDDPDARLVLAQVRGRRPSASRRSRGPATNTSISGQSARISGPVVSSCARGLAGLPYW